MRYLICSYGEDPEKHFTLPRVKYCYLSNLNVLVSNNKPAVHYSQNLGTQTYSKVHGEDTDDDINYSIVMATKTLTLTDVEGTDSDKQNYCISYPIPTITTTETFKNSLKATDIEK